jgi:hypothetical protein
MKSIKILLVIFFALSLGIGAQQKTDYSKEVGYFDFKSLLHLKNNSPVTEVYLEEPMLKMVGKMADNKGEDVSKIIAGLKLVCVNEYELDLGEFNSVESLLGTIDKALRAKQWERIIYSKHKNNFDNVYVHPDQNGEFAGLVVTSFHGYTSDIVDKSGKISLVNIVGKIDLSALGAISKEFNIPGLGKQREKEK